MKAILTSSLGGSYIFNGKRVPTQLLNDNGLIDNIKQLWKMDSRVLIISAGPEEFERNDSILCCQKEAFRLSGLETSSFELCDDRTESLADQINTYDVIVLVGGHVPTQNRFFHKIDLKNKLADYNGLVIAWSAGTMNSAEIVYAQPEEEGEGVNHNYQRFLLGLDITKKMIIPHYQSIKMDIVDGLRVIEDMTYPDSMGREFIGLNDGSYMISMNGYETLYGDAYLIKDGRETQICKKGEQLIL